MKPQRHAAILDLVRRHRIRSQEQLRDLLGKIGIDVTQATLSRDVRELGLSKRAGPDGGTSYVVPSHAGDYLHPPLEQMLQALMLSTEGVGPLLVVRTPAGSAEALAGALDRHGWQDLVGTLAGDDTILLITRSERARQALATQLRKLAGLQS